MRTALHRTSGYLLPTTLVVAGLHLARQWTAGEALAGVVSALFFTACFLAGAVLEARSHRGGPRVSRDGPRSARDSSWAPRRGSWCGRSGTCR